MPCMQGSEVRARDALDADDRRITKRSHADQKARELRDVGASTLHA